MKEQFEKKLKQAQKDRPHREVLELQDDMKNLKDDLKKLRDDVDKKADK